MPANPSREKELAAAAHTGDLQKVRMLLKAGVDPNSNDIHTPLMLAGMHGHDEIFFELVKAGADLHGKDKYGGSVLSSLAAKGSLRVIQAVLDDGIRASDELPMAMLDACQCNSIEVVKSLIAAGADVNHQDRSYSTPLLAAVRGNQPEIVAELLKRGATTEALLPRSDFGEKRHFKKNALEIAMIEGFTEIVELLRGAGARPQEKPARPAASGTIADSWKLIKKWLRENAAEWKALNKGATVKQLKQAEDGLGFRLPEELRETYSLHNGGGQIFPNPDDTSFYLMPLDEVTQDWKMQKQLLEAGDFDDRTPTSAKGIRKEWWNIKWIPFAANGGGDYFCIDLAAAKGGAMGQVISHNHETGEHQLLARSLRVWLHELVYDLRDGKYSFDEEEECLS